MLKYEGLTGLTGLTDFMYSCIDILYYISLR